MSAPNITVAIEPMDGTSVVYEPVAPESANDKAAGVICLMLTITNNESKSITLNDVTVSFTGPPSVPAKTIPLASALVIPSHATKEWNFVRETGENDSIILASTAPASVTVSLSFAGFTPWSTTKPLAKHKNPVTGNAYLYPAQFDDLRAGEFWGASSNTHGTGAAGSQLFAYDMVVVGWDESKQALNQLLPGKDGTHNTDYRVWGKKLHAMADGTVLQFVNDCPNNEPPIGPQLNGDPTHDNPIWAAQATKFWGAYDNAHGGEAVAHAGAGNHFYIQHGEEVVLYAHMQKGSLNPALVKNPITPGAPPVTVKAGDFLGLAGNAGNASGPHLHIHAIKGTQPETGPLRPLLFRDMFAIDAGDLKLPSITGPWVRVNVEGPPLGPQSAMIWPLNRNPEWAGWQDLGGPIKAPPAVSSWAVGRLDVFSAGSDGQLNHKWWDGTKWHDFQKLGGAFQGGPAAVSWGANRIDVFVQGTDNHLGHFWWDGSKWNGWENLGGTLTSAPAVASWGPNRLDVFAAGTNGQLQHRFWDGTAWHNWENLGGSFKGAPAAVSWGPNRIDLFIRGMNDHLGHRFWNGTTWSAWEDLGAPALASSPAVAAWGPNRLDVFAAGTDGNMIHKWWDGSKWSGWDWVGGVFQGNPAAVSWGSKRIDVFAWGTDNKLGHLWEDLNQ